MTAELEKCESCGRAVGANEVPNTENSRLSHLGCAPRDALAVQVVVSFRGLPVCVARRRVMVSLGYHQRKRRLGGDCQSGLYSIRDIYREVAEG